jgi:hypothetical protein
VTLTITAPSTVASIDLADAYGAAQTVALRNGHAKVTVATSSSGGWYDVALSAAADTSFAYQLSGRLETAGQLTSDPQLGG